MADPATDLYRSMFTNVHQWLDGTTADLTDESAAWQPPGRVVPAGAHFAHHLIAEDFFLNHVIGGGAPLLMSEFEGRTGFSEMPPMGAWDDWARGLKVDLAQLREYASAVYASTDAFLARQMPADLEKVYDFSEFGWPEPVTLGVVLHQLVANAAAHCGEISCIKGLQGIQGYPF